MAASGLSLIVGSVVDRIDELVDRCVTAIWEAVPAYARLGPEFSEEVRHAVRENVRILSQVLARGQEIGREELEAIERTGARRAEAGIPLEDVLQAYRTVSRVCWDMLAEECRTFEGDALEASIALAEALLRYTDQISTSVADAYAKAQRSIVREQEGARREFLSDLLYGTDASPENILSRAHSFGYDLSLSYIALVGLGPQSDARKEVAVSTAAARVTSQATAEPIVLQKAEQTIALLPIDASIDTATMPEKLVAELGADWHFGMGGPDPGLEGIRRAYLEAREALEIGAALGLEGPVYRFDDVIVYHFLRAEPPLVDRFVHETLGPLIEYDQRRKGELLKTLEAYFNADGSVKSTGELLFAHPHTVTYRLKQVEKLTGWSLRAPEDKLRIQLALRAHRIAQARPE